MSSAERTSALPLPTGLLNRHLKTTVFRADTSTPLAPTSHAAPQSQDRGVSRPNRENQLKLRHAAAAP